MLSDYNVFTFLTNPFFFKCHFFLDSCVKLSFLDVWFVTEGDEYNASRDLFDFLMWDMFSFMHTQFFFSQALFYTNNQDLFSTLLYHSPELVSAVSDFFNSSWGAKVLNFSSSASFDSFTDKLLMSREALVNLMLLLVFLFWVYAALCALFRNVNWVSTNVSYLVRIYTTLNFVARSNHLEFTAVLGLFFLIVLYYVMEIFSGNDAREEETMFLDSLFLYLFSGFVVYLIFRLSIHFYSFMEGAMSGSHSISTLLVQFNRDMTNTVVHLSRCATLIVRLNVYDFADDVVDSYVIFLDDFTDDEYILDLLAPFSSTLFFDVDNKDDRSFMLEGELDSSLDLFSLYFLIWGKLSLFWFFNLELIARVIVALYITFLMIFEVLAIDRSYVEDTFISQKRGN